MTRTRFFTSTIRTVAAASHTTSPASKFVQPKILSPAKHTLRSPSLSTARYFSSAPNAHYRNEDILTTLKRPGNLYTKISTYLEEEIKALLKSFFENPEKHGNIVKELQTLVDQFHELDYPGFSYSPFLKRNLGTNNLGSIPLDPMDCSILHVLFTGANHPRISSLIKNYFQLVKEWSNIREESIPIDLNDFFKIEEELCFALQNGKIMKSKEYIKKISDSFSDPKSLRFDDLSKEMLRMIGRRGNLTPAQEAIVADYQEYLGISRPQVRFVC